jgi:hypothetical protein
MFIHFLKMKIFKDKKFFGKDLFWLLLVVVFSVFAFRTLIQKGYFPMHDDLQMMRQLELEKCFKDFQIPCRWVPDMGYGFGFPLFNFYPPLPYLIGSFFRIFTIAFTDVAKILFSLSFTASGISMYFFAKAMFGKASQKFAKMGAFVSAVFYIWAPYHSVDVFVRGAMNEAWALVFFPLILWTAYRLITEKSGTEKWFFGLTFSWVGLFLSHNLMVMIFSPIFVLWCLIFIWRSKNWKRILNLAGVGILILCLSAFFTVPAIFEQQYVQVNTLVSGYYEYIAHFVTINQLLISRFWGYGASVWGPIDGMPFPVGHFHWIASLIILGYLVVRYLKKRETDELSVALFSLIVIGWIATFMCHSRSTFIWQHVKPLGFVQFPWRFLTISTFAFSFAAGAIVLFLSKFKKALIYLVVILLAGLVAWNWSFFKVERFGPVTDQEKFSGEAWRLQQTAGIYDYLPNTAEMAPQSQRKYLAEVVDGKAEIGSELQGSNWAKFNANVATQNSVLRIGILKFPTWKAFVDGKEIPNYVGPNEKWGRMYIDVPQGNHSVYLRLYNTPIRTVSNWVSLATWLGLSAYLLVCRKMVKSKA